VFVSKACKSFYHDRCSVSIVCKPFYYKLVSEFIVCRLGYLLLHETLSAATTSNSSALHTHLLRPSALYSGKPTHIQWFSEHKAKSSVTSKG